MAIGHSGSHSAFVLIDEGNVCSCMYVSQTGSLWDFFCIVSHQMKPGIFQTLIKVR